MANPVIVACAADVWTKVATAVLTGNIWVKDKPSGGMMQTYRLTGDPAPTLETESMPILDIGIAINNSVGIDVYIYSKGGSGSVRVDI